MREQFTINEIAEALNLSRNTVSKVVNNKDGVSSKTKELVTRYISSQKQLHGNSSLPLTSHPQSNGYVVFTYRYENAEYLNNILSNVEATLKLNGYSLLLNIIRDDTADELSIPTSLYDGSACGVISFNIFDQQYWKEITSMKIPSVFIDTFYASYLFANKTDIVTVESTQPIHFLVDRFIEKGAVSFGFIGYPYYCYSIFQRWNTLKQTLEEHDLILDESKCILNTDYFYEPDAVSRTKELLKHMGKIPEVFICSSDLYAIILSKALQESGYHIPVDVSIVGFDNCTETQRQTPSLSTVDAHPDLIGKTCAQVLIERISNPDLPHKFILCQSDIVLRESTDL